MSKRFCIFDCYFYKTSLVLKKIILGNENYFIHNTFLYNNDGHNII